MSDIGIIGAGTAGLHLALLLQLRGLEPTLYAERTADEVRRGRLPTPSSTTTAHARVSGRSAPTCGTRQPRRSRVTGIRSPTEPERLEFPGYFPNASLSVDYRLYQSRLLELFEERGGKVEVGPVSTADLGRLGERHDLLAVSTGRGELIDLFPPLAGRSPFQQPARLLSAGLYRGIADAGEPRHIVLSLLGPLGEIINIPMESGDGMVEVVLFECVPGGDLEGVARTPYADDPKAHDRLVLEKLRMYAPRVFERVDEASFGVVDPSSIVQGAIVPTVRAVATQARRRDLRDRRRRRACPDGSCLRPRRERGLARRRSSSARRLPREGRSTRRSASASTSAGSRA